MTHQLTTTDLDQFTTRNDWDGSGYIGERETQHASIRSGEHHPANADLIAKADQMLLDAANAKGLTADELFTWANSKRGRWYGDCWFGSNGSHATKYLP